MTNPTPLSPAAQAVLVATTPALNNFDACGFNHQHYDRKAIAAALRAAADQVVPKSSMPLYVGEATHADWFARDDVRDNLLRIATELDGAQ